MVGTGISENCSLIGILCFVSTVVYLADGCKKTGQAAKTAAAEILAAGLPLLFAPNDDDGALCVVEHLVAD
jgi:hypothetical protein